MTNLHEQVSVPPSPSYNRGSSRRTCSAEGCERVHHSSGYCKCHYERLRRGYSLINPCKTWGMTLKEKFLASIIVPDDPDACWGWDGPADKDGYGTMANGRKNPVRAHRYSFEYHSGEILGEDFALHSCNNSACSNPLHLRRGNAKENADDRTNSPNWKRGEDHPACKISDADVLAIRSLNAKQRDIAKMYGVSQTLVCRIRRGQNRKVLACEPCNTARGCNMPELEKKA